MILNKRKGKKKNANSLHQIEILVSQQPILILINNTISLAY